MCNLGVAVSPGVGPERLAGAGVAAELRSGPALHPLPAPALAPATLLRPLHTGQGLSNQASCTESLACLVESAVSAVALLGGEVGAAAAGAGVGEEAVAGGAGGGAQSALAPAGPAVVLQLWPSPSSTSASSGLRAAASLCLRIQE